MKEEHKDAIEVSIIFHEGQRMFAVPKQPAPVQPADGTQVSKVWWDGEKLMAKPIPLEDFYLPAPVHGPDWKAEYLKSVESGCITLDELRETLAELDATNRQVEILSDALAESRREVAALKAVQEPWGYGRMSWGEKMFLPTLPSERDGGWMALYTTLPAAQPAPVPLTARELELIDGMIEVQLDHAKRCDSIANRTMAERQKGWDMERVALLQKLKENT